jgi:hypothetical protein
MAPVGAAAGALAGVLGARAPFIAPDRAGAARTANRVSLLAARDQRLAAERQKRLTESAMAARGQLRKRPQPGQGESAVRAGAARRRAEAKRAKAKREQQAKTRRNVAAARSVKGQLRKRAAPQKKVVSQKKYKSTTGKGGAAGGKKAGSKE